MMKACEVVHSAIKIDRELLDEYAKEFAKKETKKRPSLGELRSDDGVLELNLRSSTHTYRHGSS